MPPIDQILWTLFYAGVLPALLAAALMTVVCWLAGRFDPGPYIGAAVALAAGLALGNWLGDDLVPLWPERFGWQWLGWAVLGALALGMLARLPFVPPGLGWGLWGLASANAGWLLTPAALRDEFFWAPLVLGAIIFAEWVVLEEVGRLDLAGLIPLALVPAALTATALLVPSSARFGQIALVLAGSLAGVGGGGLLMRREGSGVVAGVAVMLPALILSGWHDNFAEPPVPTKCFLLAALAPLALVPSLIPAWQRYQRKGLWVVQLLIVLVPVITAIALAAQAGALSMDAHAEEEW